MSDSRVWMVTGASSGFGREIASAALARGDRVVATARRAESVSDLGDGVLGLALDVTDSGQRQAAVAAALERFGRIDVLVNNAGRTQVGAVEETSEEELRDLFELHFFGPAALTQAVLPGMRERGSGAIVQMSSVGGHTSAPGFGAYCATKFAIEGLTQALHEEVAGFGIRTLIVEPGAFRTGLFRSGSAYESAELPAYAEVVGPTRAYVREGDGDQAGDPAKAAAAILTVLDSEEPPLRLVLGADAIEGIREHLAGLNAELDEWERLGADTAIDSVE
jgi:NAD(P)-dependent dehydrogenase (short-subunit alcohol dehydrogenase family)